MLCFCQRATTQDPAARQALVAELHKLKTDLFMTLVETGAMPLRPGVARLVQEAIAAGVCVWGGEVGVVGGRWKVEPSSLVQEATVGGVCVCTPVCQR